MGAGGRTGFRARGTGLRLLFQLPAFHRDKAGAKALDAAVVLVATALVDLTLAAQRRLERLHRQAVGFFTAVAASLAHQLIDHHAFGRVDQRAALAPAALFRGAGLVVDDDGRALDLAQLALYGVQLIAVVHGHAFGQRDTVVFFGLVGHHHRLHCALCPHALRYLHDRMAFRPLADLLAAGHRHGVVIKNLVGDVDARCNALADREHAAVKIGAVAQVGKDVLVSGERRLPDPRHALAAHLGKSHGAAVHPQGHEVAANAGHRARAFGHPGTGVVRATRAEPGRAVGLQFGDHQRPLLGGDDRQARVDAGQNTAVKTGELADTACNRLGDQRGRQVGIGAQQDMAGRVGHRPLATGHLARQFIKLAQHIGTHIGAPVVQLFLQLVFDDLTLFLDHQHLLQAGGKFPCGLGFQRPDHAHLVHTQTNVTAGIVVQPQVEQRLAGVVIRLAAGDQAQPVVLALDHVVVEAVGPDVGQRRIPFGVEQPLLLVQRVVRPADVHTARRQGEIGRDDGLHTLGVDHRGGAGFDNLLDGLHARPDARKAAHREGVHAKVQDFLNRRGEKHRQPASLENVIALVRRSGALGNMVVTRDRQHATPGGGTGHVGMFEHVAGAVHARTFAVPDTEHTVVFVGAGRGKAQLLRAPDRSRCQFFIDARLENNVALAEVLGRTP